MDPPVLLVLLAVRSRGGQTVPAAADEFKALKKAVAQAKERGWIAEQQGEVSVTGKTGKTTRKKAPVLSLTAAGNQVLHQAASPDALAATGAVHAQSLQKSLEADRQALRQEVLAALSAKAKSKGASDPSAELRKISTTLEKVSARVAKLEAGLTSSADGAALTKIDAAFARLQSKLGAAASSPAPPSPPDGQPSAQPLGSGAPDNNWLRSALEYIAEFQRRNAFAFCPLPELYHAVAEKRGLSIGQFHDGLRRLVQDRRLRLHPFTGAQYQLEQEHFALVASQGIQYYAERLADS